jgi:DDE superfamily endonuclease
LLWIENPSTADCEQAACGAKKFFCGRKHKFGLNLQGTCDAEGRFLDISIAHPASCSDFLAYTASKFCKKLEVPGFLAPGLCLFGDLAYVTNSFFVTPYKHAKNGVQEDFNFYHSQLRINIECAFGMLVGRWGLLRRALPQSLGLKKVVGMTLCLARLHNFCIDRNGKDRLLQPLAYDNLEILAHGGLPDDENRGCPSDLLDSGDHHQDTNRAYRQAFVRNTMVNRNNELPRDQLLRMIEHGEFKRPLPNQWKS